VAAMMRIVFMVRTERIMFGATTSGHRRVKTVPSYPARGERDRVGASVANA
jgi:hypothetical protein